MNKIDFLKQNFTIRELAEKFGAKPDRTGKCKHNPIRQERTSSLKIYDETNTFHDFGSNLTGDVITFYSEYYSMDISDTIESMLREFGKTGDDFKEDKQVESPKQETWTPSIVQKAFSNYKDISLKEHKDILLSIVPEYILEEANTDDKIEFYDIVKFGMNTAVVLLPNYKGVSYTFRYRHKQVGDEIKKWVAQFNTTSNYAYCRLNNNPNFNC